MISLNSLGYPLEKNAIHSNSSGFPFKKTVIRSKGWGYPARNKLSSTWTAQVINSKQLSAALLFQTTFNQTVCANLSKNISLNNSSKRCLPSPHEFPRYIFCWIAIFAFITLDYRCTFYSRLSYNIQTFPEQVMFWSIKCFWQSGISSGNALPLSMKFALIMHVY